MASEQYILGVVGVNLAAFLADTSDLSTIRGGGLLLLDGVDWIEAHLKHIAPGSTTISRGASEGLFLLPVGADGAALRDQVDAYLKCHSKLRHATFVVDVEVLHGKDDFPRAREMLRAKNRWRQMQSPSLAIPFVDPGAVGGQPCEENAIRPAAPGKDLSPSVQVRKDYGRDRKQGIYAHLTGLSGLPPFATEFNTIAADIKRGNLDNKMAVVYFDGNAFGKLQKDQPTPQAAQDFDTDLRNMRQGFLKQILQEMILLPDFFNGDTLRFETLLWGGDEMMFVLPAWRGWWFLQRFFEISSGWQYPTDTPEGTRLHHAAGLVFCNHKAPIARISHLAKELADYVKTALGDEGKRHQSGLAYLTLESFDGIGSDITDYLQRKLLPKMSAKESWWLPADLMTLWAARAPEVLLNFPKRRAHRAALELSRGGNYDKVAFEAGLAPELLSALEEIAAALPDPTLLPLHLALLWDYLDNREQE